MQDDDFKISRLKSRQSYSSLDRGSHKKIKRHLSKEQCPFFIIEFKIYVFTDSTAFQHSINELINISEALSRTAHINEFEITEESLFRAKSLNYKEADVINFLKSNSRNHKGLPKCLQDLIAKVMTNSDCTKLYLMQKEDKNCYYFEISMKDLQDIVPEKRKDIEECLSENYELVNDKEPIHSNNYQTQQQETQYQTLNPVRRYIVKDYHHNKLAERLYIMGIPISSEKVIQRNQHVQTMKRNTDLFRNKGAIHCKDIKITLKAFTKLRDYQSEALKSVVVAKDGVLRAKSGYIVLPCGAGKTLLGIAICVKIKKETLIVCSNDSGADQWKREIEKWTQGLSKDQIIILTSKSIADFKWKVNLSKPHIYISTYSNLKSKFDPKQGSIKNEHEWIKLMPWGCVIFDEAQWLPAPGNREIINSLLAHCKVGLTATPLREDNEIKALIFMLGPQLYIGSWKKFVEHGYLANPKCIEVRTKMTRYFKAKQKEYEKVKEYRENLYQSNPSKIKALIFLLEYHESLNDQIIVFCDRLKLTTFLAESLGRPLLWGDVETQDRNFVFDMFRQGIFKTIFLTRIGDEAIDLPNANVAIELNMHKGSRRQMLQRLGRIMRPKQASSSFSYNAVFYTIVSDETLEMKYFSKRRNYLVDLGFQYDLRLFEYGDPNPNIPDIFYSDQEVKEKVMEKYNTVISDEAKYWEFICKK